MTANRPDGRSARWPTATSVDDLREWRWRSYLDHLEDLGYDLEAGEPMDDPSPVGPGATDAQPSLTPVSPVSSSR